MTESAGQDDNAGYADTQSRRKSSHLQNRPTPPDDKGSNARFLYNLLGLNTPTTSLPNFLLKTVTFTLTSTCTALSFVTCVPRAYVDPPLPASAATCVRRRQIDSSHDDINDQAEQFPILPSRVQL